MKGLSPVPILVLSSHPCLNICVGFGQPLTPDGWCGLSHVYHPSHPFKLQLLIGLYVIAFAIDVDLNPVTDTKANASDTNRIVLYIAPGRRPVLTGG